MSVTIYHNPRCAKSRQTLALLQERGVEPTVVKYLESPPDAAALSDLCDRLGMSPRALLRTGEAAYKALGLGDPAKTDAEILDAMAANPILIERPIVVRGDTAVLGRPPENALRIL
jgi:arsenate reductase